MDLTLVVMAAGIGSRFGGAKQLARVGPDGEAFLDFAIADAAGAGVERTVIVVRSEIEADLRRHVEQRHGHRTVEYVCQDTHGPPRAKPWGTAHAVLSAAEAVPGAFIVCNADDYYGQTSYRVLGAAARTMRSDEAVLAGFALGSTLPASGGVSRGVCTVDEGRLAEIVEHHGIERSDGGIITAADPPARLDDEVVVSMNLWAFPPALFERLASDFEDFLADSGADGASELLLPTVVSSMMANGQLTVRVVTTDEPWVGVTNPEDLEVARRRIAELRT